ncbi:MAG TPA: hypothetical protein VHU18_05010 [Rhizomicrobium sp.]|jgi:hypothetical protein|nr:hypothetical protein [Rhizomicrobium sp.]
MESDLSFSSEVAERLKFYVYRLIDPRNGETFYVGKGKGIRVFAHVRGERGADGDDVTDKIKRIRDIVASGFEVAHVIRRHGMENEVAFEVEAALLDAYPEATNIAGGRGSDEFGVMHSKQIIERYQAKDAEFAHNAILITINRSITEGKSIYDAVRYAWKIDAKKAQKAELVLAVQQGLIVGVFVPERWLEATTANFPGTVSDRSGRRGFVGREAPHDISSVYLRRRIPDHMRKPGAANPVRYTF